MLLLLCAVALLHVATHAEPDFVYLPDIDRIPGFDFIGWGYDATYRDQFFALKPQLFQYSFDQNFRKSEKTYRYPLDDVTYAVADQLFARTMAKTTTSVYQLKGLEQERQAIDIRLQLKGSVAQFEGQLKARLLIDSGADRTQRIVKTVVISELWQLYLGRKYLQPRVARDLLALRSAGSFARAQSEYYLFFTKYGTHFVDSVTVGGSMETRTAVDVDSEQEGFMIAASLAGKYMSGGTTIEGNLSISYQTAQKKVNTETTAAAIIYGGDARFSDFVLRANDPTSTLKILESWKATLLDNPVVVRYRLVEIWHLWGLVYRDYTMGAETCKAMATFLGFLPYEDPQYCQGAGFLLSGYVREPGLFKGDLVQGT